MIKIVTDSTCDLPKAIIEQYDITVVPAYVNIDDESLTDGVQLTREQFYNNLDSYKTHPTTSAPAPAEFTAAYKKVIASGATQIISIHISAELSSFLNSARIGIEATRFDITLVDSRSVAMGLGLLVMRAAQAAAAGSNLDEIINLLIDLIPRTYVYAAADSLEYLRRSGRVGFAQAGIGSLLQIKPILIVTDGKAISFDRVRTTKKIAPTLVNLLAKHGELENLAVIDAAAPERAQALKEMIADRFPPGSPQIVAQIGPAIGAHIGPGTLGIALIEKA